MRLSGPPEPGYLGVWQLPLLQPAKPAFRALRTVRPVSFAGFAWGWVFCFLFSVFGLDMISPLSITITRCRARRCCDGDPL